MFFIVKMTKQLTEPATAHSFSKLLNLSFYMHTCIILTIHHYWLQFLTCQLRLTVITHGCASLWLYSCALFHLRKFITWNIC